MESQLFAGLLLVAAGAAQAAGPQVTGVYMFRDYKGINDVGAISGDRMFYGGTILGGSEGYSLRARYGPTGFVDPVAACAPLSTNANFCAQTMPYSTARLAEPWTISFFDAAGSTNVVGPSVAATNVLVPFPTSVTVSSGSGSLTPTIAWTLPEGYVPDGFRAQILDKNKRIIGGGADTIYSMALSPTATSFTFPSGILEMGGSYSINFQVVETIGDIPFTNRQIEILSRSNSFFSFSPLAEGSPPNVHLPQVGEDPNPNDNLGAAYVFSIDQVGPGSVTYIDPYVAIGYQYATGAGDPNFASVIFPDVGDGIFELQYQTADGLQMHSVLAGDQFFFEAGGVGAFTVVGIETDVALNPLDATAFVTGLSFVANGTFTGTMTPIITVTAVPEPHTYALMFAGLGLLGAVARRQNSSKGTP